MRFGALTFLAVVAAALVAGCGGSESGSGGDDFSFSSDDQQHWIDTWCDLDLGMTRDEVISAMGEPTEEYDAESGSEPQSQWGQGFTVFYDSEGNAASLQANELSLDSSEQSQLSCELSRQEP